MGRIQWTRAAQFHWVFDNMGGAPLQEAVAGNWDQAAALVEADGRVRLAAPRPGAGQVYLVRGVWSAATGFPWKGFWADPMSGDLRNYYQGGSFGTDGGQTLITLGTPLPPDTPVQVYYIYLTGEVSAKYEPLNDYPCIRRARRSRDDFTYDFAVDRLLDLMVLLHLAGRERGRDYAPLIRFLWEALAAGEASRPSPLLQDSFERQDWERGVHLMYRGATAGGSFPVFQSELAAGASGRALHVRAELAASRDAAWFGYGLDWPRESAPFTAMDRLTLAVRGQALGRRLHNLTKIGSGGATLVLQGDYAHQEKRRFAVQIETTGAVGAATFRWSRDGGLTWEAGGLVSGDRQHPVALEGGVQVYWESGAPPDLVAGDYWTFWGGGPAEHPQRLLVTLNDAPAETLGPWSPEHTYVHAIPDRVAQWTDFDLPFSQFWRRDNLIDDPDRVQTMWGAWYSSSQPDDSDLTIGTREETEIFQGETFYTQRLVTWSLSPYATAFGVWAGIDPGRCDSTGHDNVNFLINPAIPGLTSVTLRVKVKDARGSYLYREVAVAANTWQRVVVAFADLAVESGSLPLCHPLQVVDIGIPAAPPANGAFYVTDLKFGEHLTFAAAPHLKVLEFKLEHGGVPGHDWWLDNLTLNLAAQDPYPYAPRLALSLTPCGQNPWRGPTLVHYAQPLGPFLVGASEFTRNYLNLHRDAQEEFHRLYGGVKGPVMPLHTRNDVENIALCGAEDFNRFSWWRRYRDFGKVAGFWHFNEVLADASGRGSALTWQGGGEPVYASGICQPGATAVDLDGSHCLTGDGPGLNPGAGDFTWELVLQAEELTPGARLLSKMAPAGPGYELLLGPGGAVQVNLADEGSAATLAPVPGLALDAASYHYVAVSVDRDGVATFCVDGVLGTAAAACPGSLDNGLPFTLGRAAGTASGFFRGKIDLVRVQQRALSGAELRDNWKIIRGELNGSAYPEVGCALGQFWSFLRLAQYFYVSRDPAAWEILENWLGWLDIHGAPDGHGWKFPMNFSEFGFTYGAYDPGATAPLALGCLYIYLRNGCEPAALWARRLLDDLRQNRQDPDYGGYRSDYHYAWLNALVLQAFGLAVNGAAGQSYRFAASPEDRSHFDALFSWLWAHSGDEKPNILNADLIPFYYAEDADVWDYAPNYLAMRQVGTLEAVVAMLGAALEYAKAKGDWTWWQRLLDFILRDNLTALAPSQVRSLTTAYQPAGVKNLVRVFYADYDRDNRHYTEARDEAAISRWQERPVELDLRYGSPVVLENPAVAQLLAERLLARLAAPREEAEVETWLEGVRIEVGDTLAVSSDFHGLEQAEFSVSGKEVDLDRRRVRLTISRPLEPAPSWALDAAGSVDDAWALDQDSSYDPGWSFRAYAG